MPATPPERVPFPQNDDSSVQSYIDTSRLQGLRRCTIWAMHQDEYWCALLSAKRLDNADRWFDRVEPVYVRASRAKFNDFAPEN